MGQVVTVRANANKGYVWDIAGGTYGLATGTSVPHGNSSSPYYVPHLDFNWPTIPTNALILSAIFGITWSGGVPPHADGGSIITDISVYEITQAWTEGGVKPTSGSIVCDISMNVAAGTLVTASILPFVQSRYAGSTKYGLTWGSADYRDSPVYHYGYDQANKAYVEFTYYVPEGLGMLV